MTTPNNDAWRARKAHKILDDLFKGNMVLDEEREFLRRALPERPKQKTLAEITGHVKDAWACSLGIRWDGTSDDPDISVVDWLAELHEQLKGLKDAPEHPEFLETEEDYASAPRGTVAAKDGWLAWLKETDGAWSCGGGSEGEASLAQSGKRRVLRWGWGE